MREERRIDPSDGEAYTIDEFIEAYGGTDEFYAAEPASDDEEDEDEDKNEAESDDGAEDLGEIEIEPLVAAPVAIAPASAAVNPVAPPKRSVEEIVSERKQPCGAAEYFVKWSNTTVCSWEPESVFETAREILEAWRLRRSTTVAFSFPIRCSFPQPSGLRITIHMPGFRVCVRA